jgi:ankyrin repeat protein
MAADSIPDAEINTVITTMITIDRDQYPETFTHLRFAAQAGKLDDVANLLRRGANPDIAGIFSGTTALHDAIRLYHPQSPEIVRLLLDHGASVEPVDRNDDCSALDYAVRGLHFGVIKLLLAHGAKATFRKLHIPVKAEKEQADAVIRLLLEHGADVNVPGVWNRTILMWAAMNASVETIELLLKAGADVNYVAVFNNLSETALSLAQKAKRKDVTDLLMKAGARPPPLSKPGRRWF